MQNVFGEAKPREAVIAERTGKSEEEILKESVKAEKLRVRDLSSCNITAAYLPASSCPYRPCSFV